MRGLVLAVLVGVTVGDFNFGHSHGQEARGGRQEDGPATGGIDFSGCEEDPETGLCCVDKEETVTTVEKDPILECTHKNVEQCHYTYVTQFTPTQEEVCDETFEKSCSITFKQQAFNETIRKCYTPIEKVCNGQGPEVCQTVYESSCSTKYVEKSPGKFVGDTGCEKLPVEICGAGCVFEEGVEECHDKTLVSLVDVPEEHCDLNPQKICKFITKLVPKLAPKHECTIIPKETCILKFSQPRQVEKPLQTRWCLDPTPAAPGESYDEENALADPIESGSATAAEPAYAEPEIPAYEPAVSPDTSYLSPGGERRGRQFVQRNPQRFQGALPARNGKTSSFNPQSNSRFGTKFV